LDTEEDLLELFDGVTAFISVEQLGIIKLKSLGEIHFIKQILHLMIIYILLNRDLERHTVCQSIHDFLSFMDVELFPV